MDEREDRAAGTPVANVDVPTADTGMQFAVVGKLLDGRPLAPLAAAGASATGAGSSAAGVGASDAAADVLATDAGVQFAAAGAPATNPAWNSAFYRFAERIRELTHGSVNHKIIYALVGSKGRYINHKSPEVRKRTAASLSRLMHSCRYAADMRARLGTDPAAFGEAAHELAALLQTALAPAGDDLRGLLLGPLWDEIRAGLASEVRAGRSDVSLARVDAEHAALAAWCVQGASTGGEPAQADAAPAQAAATLAQATIAPERIISQYLHVMAWGHMDEDVLARILPKTPDAAPSKQELAGAAAAEREKLGGGAFLARLAPGAPFAALGAWRVPEGRPLSIGRLTSCDVIERFAWVSPKHCRVLRQADTWFVQDEGSRYGTRVFRAREDGGRRLAWDSRTIVPAPPGSSTQTASPAQPGRSMRPEEAARSEKEARPAASAQAIAAAQPASPAQGFPLVFGDIIELAGGPRYLFGSLACPSGEHNSASSDGSVL